MQENNSVGHPKIWQGEKLQELIAHFKKYIDETEIPIVAEFAYKYNIRRQLLYELPELSDTIKEIIEKKESALERKALEGDINVSMAIFSLKQLGWKDKQEHELSGPGGGAIPVEVVNKAIDKVYGNDK
jgi:hypothetical protein